MNNLLNYTNYHFVGVLGASMSGLAKLLSSRGKRVTGSDVSVSPVISELKRCGVSVTVGSGVSAVQNSQIVVRSSAVPDTDPQIAEAMRLGIPVVDRADMLGAVADGFDTVIAVSGTHGKSTVTAMIGEILRASGTRPFVHVGVHGAGTTDGDGQYAVIEACEYRSNFLKIHPDVAVVLNVERDHPDCYSDDTALMQAFERFVDGAKPYGRSVMPAGLTLGKHVPTLVIGTDVVANEVIQDMAGYSFVPVVRGQNLPRVSLKVMGRHNVTNALFALATARLLGVDDCIAVNALNGFNGLAKRFQTVGTLNGASVVVDYAHHPTAIRLAIDTARLMTKGHVTVLFQPHTYSRTKALFEEFVSALSGANVSVIMKEFPAREVPADGRSAFDLFSTLRANGARTRYVTTTAKACEVATRYAYSGDVILVLGAGNMGDEICDVLKRYN